MRVNLMNFGDGIRIVHDANNVARQINPGRALPIDLAQATYETFKNATVTDTLLMLPADVEVPGAIRACVALMSRYREMKYDDFLREARDILGIDSLPVRPIMPAIREVLQSVVLDYTASDFTDATGALARHAVWKDKPELVDEAIDDEDEGFMPQALPPGVTPIDETDPDAKVDGIVQDATINAVLGLVTGDVAPIAGMDVVKPNDAAAALARVEAEQRTKRAAELAKLQSGGDTSLLPAGTADEITTDKAPRSPRPRPVTKRSSAKRSSTKAAKPAPRKGAKAAAKSKGTKPAVPRARIERARL